MKNKEKKNFTLETIESFSYLGCLSTKFLTKAATVGIFPVNKN